MVWPTEDNDNLLLGHATCKRFCTFASVGKPDAAKEETVARKQSRYSAQSTFETTSRVYPKTILQGLSC